MAEISSAGNLGSEEEINWDTIFIAEFEPNSESEDSSSSDECSGIEEKLFISDKEVSSKVNKLQDGVKKDSDKETSASELDNSKYRGTKYSLPTLYNDGERLLEETLKEIITDPFHQIPGSQHGPELISIAQCFLANRALSDVEKFRQILCKLWKAATSGDTRKVSANRREKMWHTYHNLCSNPDFVAEVSSFLRPALLQQPFSALFVQTLVRKLFEKIVLQKTRLMPSETEDISEDIPLIEENILRYAAGFVPFALTKQCMKRLSKDSDAYIKCLSAIGVPNEVGNPQTFLEYTKCWLEKQDRGGLFQLKNDAYLFFREVERHCRKYFNTKRMRTLTDSANIKLPVLNAVYKDKVAMEQWAEATVGQDPSVSHQVMQMCVKLWVNIRGHAFAANWIENFKHMQTAEAARKKSLRKSLKDITASKAE